VEKERRTGVERRWPTAPVPNPIRPARRASARARYGTGRVRGARARSSAHVHALRYGERYMDTCAAASQRRARGKLPFRSIPPFHSSLARTSKLSPLLAGPPAPILRLAERARAREYRRSSAVFSNQEPIGAARGLECLFLSETSSQIADRLRELLGIIENR